MSKNKVLILLENSTYPQDPRVRQESRVLATNGYQVSVIAPSDNQPFHEVIEDIHVYRYPEPPIANGALGYIVEFGYSLLAIFLLSFIVLVRHGFHIIHANNPPDILVLIAIFYKLLGKKFVFDHHDLAPEMYQVMFPDHGKNIIYRTLLFFEKLSCRVADGVIETNQSYQENDVARNNVSPSKITIVRNGPKLDWQNIGKPAEGLDRPGKITIGYAGNIGHHDGLDYLLKALHEMAFKQHRTDFFCFVFGGGDAYEDMRRLAGELNLDEYIHFTGWLDIEEVLPSLNELDICVAPEPANSYNSQSTMIKIMEYMAVGKPVVAFDLKEHRRSAQDAAVYVQGDDPVDLATEIMRLMDDPQLRAELGEKGRERIETELAWEYQAKQLLNAYSRLQ